ncbi:MAG: pyridine nucleotide-disulfide oxidoreductase [Thermoprotei archaeon]|nr:MAG: pyridine nucleotide-disulfide oxidoreductase [Thermoprotei archaeon]
MNNDYDVVVIGGGPAGLASAIKAMELGLKTILIERSERLGGIPLQCIHTGFGLHYFKEDLTGPEFSYRLIDRFSKLGIEYLLNAYVHSIETISNFEKVIRVITPDGILKLDTKSIIYAGGARERHVHEIGIVGDRVSGVFTAGEAQTLMDIYGVLPGKEVVIVGSGDVGLIMARRFALEGANVKAVIEIMPYPGGLTRNIVQCLKDFGIPLYLQHAVTEIRGSKRVEKVIVSKVDARLQPIKGSKKVIECDTVIISAGLIPYLRPLEKNGILLDPSTRGPVVNELLETSIPGIFVVGNALLINDLVDYVVEQGELAAEGASIYVRNKGIYGIRWKPLLKGRNVRLAVPHYISGRRDVLLYLRVKKPERKVKLVFREIGKEIKLPVVKPAEMIRVTILKEELSNIENKLTLEVIPA